jgi:hypothetical protein
MTRPVTTATPQPLLSNSGSWEKLEQSAASMPVLKGSLAARGGRLAAAVRSQSSATPLAARGRTPLIGMEGSAAKIKVRFNKTNFLKVYSY